MVKKEMSDSLWPSYEKMLRWRLAAYAAKEPIDGELYDACIKAGFDMTRFTRGPTVLKMLGEADDNG